MSKSIRYVQVLQRKKEGFILETCKSQKYKRAIIQRPGFSDVSGIQIILGKISHGNKGVGVLDATDWLIGGR